MQASDSKQLAQGLQLARQAAERGDFEHAKRTLAPLFKTFPGHPDILQLMAQVSHLEGRSDLALNLIGQAIGNNGQSASYHFTQGMILSEIKQLDHAELALRRALHLQPGMQWAMIRLGSVLRQKNQYSESRQILTQVREEMPENADALHHLATLEIDAGEFETAIPLLEELKKSELHQFAAWDQMAHARLSLGEVKQAVSCWRKALKIKPDDGNVFRQLANICRYQNADDPDIKAVETLLRDSTDSEQKVHLHLALAKMYDDLKDWSRAFAHARKGNALHHQSQPFRREQHQHLVKATIKRFDQAWAEGLDRSFEDNRPLFIIGMPRSGTTLLERMLVAHDEVGTAGELPWFELMVAQHDPVEPSLLPRLRDEYLDQLTAKSGAATRVIDKMPNNFVFVGQILTLFPNARLIHLRRHPLDVCRSIYFHHFPGGQYYANDLQDLGDYFNDYRRIMAHWRKRVPDSIIELEYEQLVHEPEQTLRALLAQLGLDWNENCLAPHKSRGSVITASAAQVRQPLNTRGIGRAAAYAEHFAPIADRIGLDQDANQRS